MGHEIKSILNRGLTHAIRAGRIVSERESSEHDVIFTVVRPPGTPPVRLRERGPRSFEEIPPSELQLLAHFLAAREGHDFGSEPHLRAVLEFHDLKRLTTQVNTALQSILKLQMPHVDELLTARRATLND
jgi:hypothetical protein